MRLELPVCKRCCFCLPLRYGLIVWAYFKLFIASLCLVVVVKGWLQIATRNGNATDIITESIATFVVTVDIILSVTFIVGCHKKSVKLIKIFYIYSQFFTVLLTFLAIYHMIWSMNRTLQSGGEVIWLYRFMDFGALLAEIAVQVYILLLIRSEMIKVTDGCQFSFVNTVSDAKCTLNIKDDSNIENVAKS